MIVGPYIRIQGTIECLGESPRESRGEGEADLVVRGRVEGVVRIDGVLIVEAGAWVLAEVTAREVIIQGTVRGNVTAREAIEIARTGRMIGDATAPRVTIAAGAGFRGRVEMGDLSGADQQPPPLSRPTEKAPEAPPVAAAQQPVVAPQQTVAAPQQPSAAPQQPVTTQKTFAEAQQQIVAAQRRNAAAQLPRSAASQQPGAAPQPPSAALQQSVFASQQLSVAPQQAAAPVPAAGPRAIPPLARPRTALKRRPDQ